MTTLAKANRIFEIKRRQLCRRFFIDFTLIPKRVVLFCGIISSRY